MKDIKFRWKDAKPLVISNKLQMPDFILTKYDSIVCKRQTSTGNSPV